MLPCWRVAPHPPASPPPRKQLLPQLGGSPPAQAPAAAAAAGLPALIAALLQLCALSSQPEKLPQVLGRACSCLPVDAAACCLQVLLQQRAGAPAAAAWLGAQQAGAALELLLQFASHKACGARWAALLADAVLKQQSAVLPLGGLWVAALSQLGGGKEADSSSNSSACGAAVAAALDAVQQLLGDGANCDPSDAELWTLQLADAGLDQLQQAAAAAAASGASAAASVAPHQVAQVLVLWPQLQSHLGRVAAGCPGVAASISGLAAAAEVLAGATLAGAAASADAWEQLMAAIADLGDLTASEEAAAVDAPLLNLAITLHNAASKISSSSSSGDGSSSSRSSGTDLQASQLLTAAFQCDLLRWTGVLAAAGGESADAADAAAAAADDLCRRAKVCLAGLARAAASGAAGEEGAALSATAAETVGRMVALLGPRWALQHQTMLQSLLRLQGKLALAVDGHAAAATQGSKAGGKPKASGSGSSSNSKHGGEGVLACTQQIIDVSDDAGAAASQVADVIAYAEARCLAQLTARSSGGAEAARFKALARQAVAAAGGARPPPGWSQAEWGAHAHLLAALCGTAEASSVQGDLLEAADVLEAGGADAPAAAKSKPKAAAAAKQPRKQQPAAEAAPLLGVAASKAEAAALCRCLAALQGAYSAAEAAATAAAAEAAAATAEPGSSEPGGGWDEPAQQQQQPAAASTSSKSSSKGAAAKDGKGARAGRGAAEEQQRGVWTPAAAARWTEVRSGLEHAARLWEQAAPASSPAAEWICRFPMASVQAVLQAWHVAALQGWDQLQRRLAGVAGALLPSLVPSEVQQVAPVLAGMPQGSWVAYLLAPASVDPSVAEALSVDRSSSSGGGIQGGSAAQLQAAAEEFEAAADDSSSGGPWGRLEAARLHLAAAHAAVASGELPVAACCGERALVLSSHIYQSCMASSSSPAESAAQQQQPEQQAVTPHPPPPAGAGAGAGASEPLLHWQSLGLYLSGLVLLAHAHELAGCPEEALRLLREASALAAAAGCAALAAAAHGAAARIWCKRGDAARAGRQLRAAEASCAALAGGDAGLVSGAALRALAACAAGDVALAAGAAAAAMESYNVAADQVDASLADGGGEAALGWWCGSLWADAQIGLAACSARQGDAAAASDGLTAALKALPADRWPTAAAAVQLELITLGAPAAFVAAEAAALASDAPRALRVVGYGGASAHSNLMEEFACAVEAEDGGAAGGGRAGGGKGKARKPTAARGKAAAAAQGGSKSAAGAAATPAGLLRPALQLLWPCRHAPLLFKRACTLLARVCELEGAANACALFLQLSLGELGGRGL